VLAALRDHGDAGQILGSDRFARAVEEATLTHQHVLVDAPPVLGFADARVLARYGDIVLVVVRAGVTLAADVRALKATFRELGVEVKGIMLERAPIGRRLRRFTGELATSRRKGSPGRGLSAPAREPWFGARRPRPRAERPVTDPEPVETATPSMDLLSTR
jgi:hypothetical protein